MKCIQAATDHFKIGPHVHFRFHSEGVDSNNLTGRSQIFAFKNASLSTCVGSTGFRRSDWRCRCYTLIAQTESACENLMQDFSSFLARLPEIINKIIECYQITVLRIRVFLDISRSGIVFLKSGSGTGSLSGSDLALK